jgi:anti-anti-sigma factor
MSDIPSTNSATQPVTVERREKALIATIQTKMLDEKELRVLGGILDEACADSGISHIVVNLEHVQIVPSLALGLLLRIAPKCSAGGRALTLAGLTPRVRDTFTVTRLDLILTLADDVEAALRG